MEQKMLLEYLGAPLNTWEFFADNKYFFKNLISGNVKRLSLNLPPPRDVCCCGKEIKIRCYVINKDSKNIKLLCKTCSERFMSFKLISLQNHLGLEHGYDQLVYVPYQLCTLRNYFIRNNISLDKLPASRTHCGCTTKIKKQHIVYNKSTDEYKIIGSSCRRRFFNSQEKKHICPNCDKLHKSYRKSLCKNCVRTSVLCECGGRYKHKNKKQHFNSIKHRHYIANH